jgi:hypothetical protein
MVYACLSLYRWGDRVRSQAGLGLAGVLLVSITIAAGMLKQFYFPPTEVSGTSVVFFRDVLIHRSVLSFISH